MTASQTLQDVIDAQAGAALSTDDIIVLMLPLFEEVAALHEQGKVADLAPGSVLLAGDQALHLAAPAGQPAQMDIGAINRVQPAPLSGLNIIGTLQRDAGPGGMQEVTDLALQTDVDAPVTRPVYLPGPRSWEHSVGHHDEITDVYSLGMALASLACGLDFSDEQDMRAFVAQRRNLFGLAQRLHPIVAAVITEMTQLNRHERATDVAALATRLRTWRDQPAGIDIDRALSGSSNLTSRRTAVLSHLRDRLFDLSRRNRLLHFRPSASTINLTVASVPLMLQLERVRAEDICTWGGPFATDLIAERPIALQQWLRFDDQPYLPAALDKLIAETRRDRAEYGFSTLRLVVAFLRWHNLKENPEERILTPLLWLPVELVKRKGVRDQYVLRNTGEPAEFNPVLRHQLSQLYGITLPETCDLNEVSVQQIHADLLAQIRQSEPSVELRLIEKASVSKVRQKAVARLQQYQRRKAGNTQRSTGKHWLPPYSYARDDYRPLGLAMFDHWVRPSPLPQRFEAGAKPQARVRQPFMLPPEPDREGYVLEESDGHRYAWDLDLTQVTLANFNYKKMSLVRDYNQLLESPDDNPAFDRVFSIEPRPLDDSRPAPLPYAQQWNVVNADATQNTAVSLARSERSFIIQGPPGTGKSQTITNLIADYAGRGQRVLFVCEKRAALDVVFHRLKQSGLEPLCCLIHDAQDDKKAFIADLKGCYEQGLASPALDADLRQQRDALVTQLEAAGGRIDAFEQALQQAPESLGQTVRALLRRLAELPDAPDATPAVREALPTLSRWSQHRELAQRLHRMLQERFAIDGLGGHAFAQLAGELVNDERAYARCEQLCEDGDALFQQLDALLESSTSLIAASTSLDQALSIAREARQLLDARLVQHLDLLDSDSAAQVELRQARAELERCTLALADAQGATAHWSDKLSSLDTESALNQLQRFENSALRWLSPAWWRLRGELNRRYDFSKHAVHPGFRKVLDQLAAEHACAERLATAARQGNERFGVEHLGSFVSDLDALQARLAEGRGPQQLVALLRQSLDPLRAAQAHANAAPALEKLAQRVSANLILPLQAELGGIAECLRDLREALDELPELLPLLRSVHAIDPACAALLQRFNSPPDALEALVAGEALHRLEREQPALARFNGAALAQAAQAVAKAQQQLLALNAQVVCAAVNARFSGHAQRSGLSAAQLDEAGKAFKKQYATGRRELEHEFSKSMRHRSIRDLADDETGQVINDLKPIWLMSPLSVSDTLPLAGDLFDVVIFDEASQIPTEEAVPALSRARQVVVVGDEMQLPPTSFFSAGGSSEDDEILVEEDGERIAINLDADSLLNQAGRNLPATLLAWHYRSRHEALISFSNAAFYDGRLVTIPDRTRDQGQQQLPARSANDEHAGIEGADQLLAQPVSFHAISDGVYEGRRNVGEARYIAQLVRELLRRETPLSLGIVAFSEAQQGAIETALETLAQDDADFATRLDREYLREDDDQFNGLFVKNLENVQGDERDVIILSICYAKGPDGKMLMNFGPINQRGGEKRLNVIFSRARHRMAVVSTIQAEAITNVHNDGAAALRAFLQFAQASASGQFERAQAVLASLNVGARQAFAQPASADSIRDALAEALRGRGHQVETNVGRSTLRCDLAIVAPGGEGYALGILLDAPHATVDDTHERYIFRPGILRSFGWKVLDVPGKDWIANPQAVLGRVEAMLGTGEDPALQVEVEHFQPVQPPAPAEPDVPAEEPAEQPATTQARVTRLRFEQGASRKFWHARLEGTRFTVSFGRIGTQGQDSVKTFESEERAQREFEKLVAEKLRKGYEQEP